MSEFRINGKFRTERIGKNWRPFSKVVECQNENTARELVYSLLGSEHGLKRNLIKIDEVNEVLPLEQ
ncbi:MAG: 50S ribosomal protein L18Ae [Methanotrichaceae archaeon]